jgi:hypothetical protein
MKTSPLGRTVTRDLGTRISCHTRTRAGRMAPHPALLPRREGDLQPAPGAQLSHPFRVSGGVQPCTAWTAWRQRSWGCCRARAPLWPQCFELAGGGGGLEQWHPPPARQWHPLLGVCPHIAPAHPHFLPTTATVTHPISWRAVADVEHAGRRPCAARRFRQRGCCNACPECRQQLSLSIR